jgi:hypothetical protein
LYELKYRLQMDAVAAAVPVAVTSGVLLWTGYAGRNGQEVSTSVGVILLVVTVLGVVGTFVAAARLGRSLSLWHLAKTK